MSAGPSSSTSSAFRPAAGQSGGTSSSLKTWMTSAQMSGAEPPFTPEMRDRQARGKDPYHSGDASDASDDFSEREVTKMRLGGGRTEQEPFDKIERRDWAIAVLASPELVMMYAQSRGDSIPATRLWLMRVMCGYEDDAVDSNFRKRPSGPRLDSSKKKGSSRPSR